jgi:hypothetical protein
MSAPHTTGLGEPGPIGKKALFRPPVEKRPGRPDAGNTPSKADPRKPGRTDDESRRSPKRVRITAALTGRALEIIQELQNQHRLRTGRALPQWRVVSDAIEYYGEAKGGGKK